MTAALAHRGPDHLGVWVDRDCGLALGQARLAVVDLSANGNAPLPWRDQRYWITYNGEVYNFAELRRELEAEGCRFRSSSDVEVVVAAYERWGAACLDRFIGMFALAIWDRRERELFLARDRIGKKPLYYAQYGARFAFASELRALLTDASLPRDVDDDAVSLYLRFGYVPTPRSVLRAVRTLPPAHRAWLRDGRLRIERYWDPLAPALQERLPLSIEEAERRLEDLLQDAVACRRVADVPIGAFLSGGIDSSLVVALLQERSAARSQTFSIQFEDPAYDESQHAARVARHLGTDHHVQRCGEREMLDVVAGLADLMDEPIADSSFIPTFLLARFARREVTVALSGDGGDELFWGYPRYEVLRRWRWLLHLPLRTRLWAAGAVRRRGGRRGERAAAVLGRRDREIYSRLACIAAADEVHHMTGRPGPRAAFDDVLASLARLRPEEAAPLVDLVTYLPDDILTKVDRASMAVGLEVRCPLLDHRVVELAVRLPAGAKWWRRGGKPVLRRLLGRRVPTALYDRPKMGFGVPLSRWLRGPLREVASASLIEGQLEDVGLAAGAAAQAWEGFITDPSTAPDLIWALLVLETWRRRWLVGRPPISGGGRSA